MLIVHSVNKVPIRLTEERWRHIIRRHPEICDQRERILETIAAPDMIQQGDYGELLAIRYYAKTPLTNKFFVVVYKEINSEDGFILTAYLTNRPSTRRRVIWKR